MEINRKHPLVATSATIEDNYAWARLLAVNILLFYIRSTTPVSQCYLIWKIEVTSEMLILRTFELGMTGEIKHLFSKG